MLLALLAALPAAWAHEARPAYLEIKETAPGQIQRLVAHAGARRYAAAGRAASCPTSVRNLKEPTVQELTDSLVERRWIDAGPDGLAGRRIEFPGLS